MSALAIIEAATAEGLTVNLSPTGSLKAIGEQKTVNRWRPLLKQHKAEIINLLATDKPGGATEAARPTVSSWCNVRCEHYHKLSIPDRGTMAWCCWEDDSTHWRRVRVDSMTKCPLKGEI